MLKVYTLLGILVCTPVAMLAAVQESSYNPEAVRELVLGYDQFVKGNYTEAMERIGELIKKRPIRVGKKTWTREELHER